MDKSMNALALDEIHRATINSFVRMDNIIRKAKRAPFVDSDTALLEHQKQMEDALHEYESYMISVFGANESRIAKEHQASTRYLFHHVQLRNR